MNIKQNKKKLWEECTSLPNLQKTAESIAREILASERFCLWLEGEMGAGKTTLSGLILKACGLNPAIPVSSPTYTLMNEYLISNQLYLHFDLYRVEEQFDPEDLGLCSERSIKGLIVEWPENSSGQPIFDPTHRLEIHSAYDLTQRKYSFYRTL